MITITYLSFAHAFKCYYSQKQRHKSITLILFAQTSIEKGHIKRFSAELWSSPKMKALTCRICTQANRVKDQAAHEHSHVRRSSSPSRLAVSCSEEKSSLSLTRRRCSRWRRRASSELFNLSDHIVTCSIPGRRKSFHLCRRKGERGVN